MLPFLMSVFGGEKAQINNHFCNNFCGGTGRQQFATQKMKDKQ
jgi:hypothetical protein